MAILDWQQKAQAKQAEAADKIPSEWRLSAELLKTTANDSNILDIPTKSGILSAHELDITGNHDATALLQKLAARELTSVEVTTAFSKRAAIAQQLTSCLTETFFDRALARAKELDDHLAATGKPVGPLHGLPISLKETFSVQGIPTSLGYVSFLDRENPSTNSALVDILLAAGAVLYVKTNVPQTMMTADSHNNVFGRVLNPHRRNLTAGGSSGGEGALIAFRGSVLGVGTDIAGSIRIPALCCGTVGFKPSVGRVPYAGQTTGARGGMVGIGPCAGPLSHSLRDAELLLRTVFNSQPENLDDNVVGFPWVDAPSQPILTIGVMAEDPKFPVHPPMQRALALAVKKLEAAGHRIVDLSGKLPSIAESCELSFRYFNLDSDRTSLSHISASGEPPIPSLRFTFDLDSKMPELTLRDVFDMNVQRAQITAQARQAFLDNKLDVIIGPGYQSCAVPHDTFGAAPYTVFGNLIDYPSCVLPFSKAEQAADTEFIRDVTYIPPYLPKEVEGAPCHVQITGRRLKDEALMEHAKIIEAVLLK
ncbi:putative general amidase [Aspergillus clavatus NRRL 1]|uniref:amidase n=1 Tax=Aspergillus clavatus (strain ATCC 1007 / CBS 513.65 / DSM 816 / NCTC 3887 / NRRL 1 / QM 1276 / 107) TaxID=344612 RepID=A1CLX5_ASPCL|nr:general amidase, putative [Aspergillus clavatus NRRL 1]EAW09104.1 general amidase, putative [Aspergillus clavatus NRRL 1]